VSHRKAEASKRRRHGYFGATVAATYDAASADMFEAGVVDPAVDVMAELAGDGRRLNSVSEQGVSRCR
jgi:hypothetical protein